MRDESNTAGRERETTGPRQALDPIPQNISISHVSCRIELTSTAQIRKSQTTVEYLMDVAKTHSAFWAVIWKPRKRV